MKNKLSGRGRPPCARNEGTAPAADGIGLQPPTYGLPSPVLLARADRGFARFLGRHGEDQTIGPAERTPARRRPVARLAVHTSSHTVLHDPDGLIEAELPLDREPYESLVKAVLAWTSEDTLAVRGYEQIYLQLTGHARAVAADVRRRASQLPKSSGRRAFADVVLREVEGSLCATLEGTVHCVQKRARLVPRPLRTVGPAGGRARPEGGCTGRGWTVVWGLY